MPDGGRTKYIHSVGVVAQIEWVAEPNQPYTGLFRGGENGFMRFSAAKSYDTSKPAAENFTPGFAIKMFRDGTYSGNFVAMFSVDGQDSWNPLKKVFSNHIGSASGLALKLLSKKFATVTKYIQEVGFSDFSQWDAQGKTESSVNFPFQLFFKAAGDL